jgi:hypothetical protein
MRQKQQFGFAKHLHNIIQIHSHARLTILCRIFPTPLLHMGNIPYNNVPQNIVMDLNNVMSHNCIHISYHMGSGSKLEESIHVRLETRNYIRAYLSFTQHSRGSMC